MASRGRHLEPGASGRIAVGRGMRVWYRVDGDGDDVVLVPTCGNDADFAGLAAPGRKLVFYDVRGRGRSDAVADPRKAGFDRQVTDVGAVRDALGIERCSIVGWSYHAGVVAHHALARPGTVTQLVLAAAIAPRSGTSTRPGREPDPSDLAVLDQLQASGLPKSDPAAWCAAWRSVYTRLLLGDPDAFERMAPVCDLRNERPDHVARAMVGMFMSLGRYEWRPTLAALDVATLLVHGDEDSEPVDSAFEWATALPDAQVLVVDGAGPFPWVERPERFFGAVNRFLAVS